MKQHATSHRVGRGFTLVEAVMATLLVSVLVVAAMRATAGSVLMQYKTAERTTGAQLANGLMNELFTLSYQDPGSSPVFGTESGESTTSKAAWNDIDDFKSWTESPPQDRDGNVMANMTSWSRSVKVEWVSSSDPTQVQTYETGAKRITIKVTHNNVLVATRVAVRTSAP